MFKVKAEYEAADKRIANGCNAYAYSLFSTLANSTLNRISTIGYTIDGGGNTISTGVAGIGMQVNYSSNVQSVTILSDNSGNCTIDIWKGPYSAYPLSAANSMCGPSIPALKSALKNTNSTLTGWNRNINADDVLQFNVLGANNLTKVNLILKVLRT